MESANKNCRCGKIRWHYPSYYGTLNWVNFNVGYHVEHHDLFNIPGWRLPQLKALAPEFYEPLVSHRSWTAIIWKFLTEPELGNFSRIERRTNEIPTSYYQ
jgi:sphingolipid delta-4 desaturase